MVDDPCYCFHELSFERDMLAGNIDVRNVHKDLPLKMAH
jgi:hypothetical protein